MTIRSKFLMAFISVSLSVACVNAWSKSDGVDLAAIKQKNKELLSLIEDQDPKVRDLPKADRNQIIKLQAKLDLLIADNEEWEALDDKTRIDVVNTNNKIWGIVADAKEDAQQCETERTTGSHLTKLRCRSARERREEGEAAREELDENRMRGRWATGN
jgi:hypothetical protein